MNSNFTDDLSLKITRDIQEKIITQLDETLENTVPQAIKNSMQPRYEKINLIIDNFSEATERVLDDTKNYKDSFDKLIKWVKPSLIGIGLFLLIIILAILVLGTGGELINQLYEWVRITRLFEILLDKFEIAKGFWKNFGWGFLIILTLAIQIVIYVYVVYAIYCIAELLIEKKE